MFYLYKDFVSVRNGFSFYPLSDPHSAGFIFKLEPVYLRMRYSKFRKTFILKCGLYREYSDNTVFLKEALQTRTLAQILSKLTQDPHWTITKNHKFCWIPRFCVVTNKFLFLKKAFEFTTIEADGPMVLTKHRFWVSEKETVLTVLGMAK